MWTVECDPAVAGVHDANFKAGVVLARAEDVDYSQLQSPYWLHGSTVCKNASAAKKDGKEEVEDVSMAEGFARAIRQFQSPRVSLENVWGYRKFDSFKVILRALEESGYAFDYWHLNAADYGVPQTRKRLILLASKAHKPRRLQPTHARNPSAQTDLFSAPLLKWSGWYRAIEDLIPDLPESRFAEWQLKRLPDSIARGILIDSKNTGQEFGKLHRTDVEPAVSVVTDGKASHMPRAFIMDDQRDGFNDGVRVRHSDAPIFTLTTRLASKSRAFIVDGKPSNSEGGELKIFEGECPVGTLTATQTRHPFRAFVAHPSADNPRFVVRTDDEPIWTQTNTAGSTRAFLAQRTSTLDVREASEPSACVLATMHSKAAKPRAWLSQGRVVSMTPRALARFQSIPDWYVLPAKNGLACLVVGNAVPSLLARRMIESMEGCSRSEVAA